MQLGNNFYEIKIWKGEALGKYISLDTETTMVPFTQTPDIVTFQVYAGGADVYYVPLEKIRLFFNKHYHSIFIAHNAAFDADVIAKYTGSKNIIYDLYDRCNIRDTGILYRLYHLAKHGFVPHRYNLALLADTFLNIKLEKDERRENFSQFLNKPISEIPQEYLEYGAGDVITTFDLYQTLLALITPLDKKNTLLSHDIQIKGELALNHIYKNGIGFDLLARDTWLKEKDVEMSKYQDILATYGWVRGMKGINEKYDQIMTLMGLDKKLPRTDDGKLSSKGDDLAPFSKNPFVAAFLAYTELEKTTSFVRKLESTRIHPRYKSLLNTGRTASSSPNIQQLPRAGGVRELFKPDQGKSFIITDYNALELAILSQVNIAENGFSVMGDLINEGKCLHYYTASQVYRKPEEEVSKEERQFAKIPNFAFPTNMSPLTFVDYCNGYGVDMTEMQALELKEGYAKAYPEISQHFWKVPYGENTSITLTGRVRANCSYTAYLNTKFQGLASDGAKLALYEMDKAGFKIVLFCHDEIVTEVPDRDVEKMKELQESIMVKSMKVVSPDVKIGVESEISKHYKK